MRRVAHQRSTLGHAIAHGKGEFDFVQKLLDLTIDGSTTHNHLFEAAAEGIDQFLAHLPVDTGVENGNIQSPTHGRLVEQGLYLFLVNLLENQRHANNEIGPHLLERLQQDFGRRNLTQQRDVRTHGQRREQVEGTPVGMGQRQERDALAPLVVQVRTHAEHHIARQVVAREHHPFAETRGSRGVVDQYHLVVVEVGIADVRPAEAVGIGIFEPALHVAQAPGYLFAVALYEAREVLQRNGGTHLGQLLHLDILPDVFAHKEHHRVGVVDNVVYIVRIELLQNGYQYGAIGNRSHEGDAPVGGVFPHESDFVAPSDLAMAEKNVQLGDFARHILIGICALFVIVGQRR